MKLFKSVFLASAVCWTLVGCGAVADEAANDDDSASEETASADESALQTAGACKKSQAGKKKTLPGSCCFNGQRAQDDYKCRKVWLSYKWVYTGNFTCVNTCG